MAYVPPYTSSGVGLVNRPPAPSSGAWVVNSPAPPTGSVPQQSPIGAVVAASNPWAGVAPALPPGVPFGSDFTGALPIAGNFEYAFYEGTRSAFNSFGGGRNVTQGEMADLMMRGTQSPAVARAPWSFGPSVGALQRNVGQHAQAVLHLQTRGPRMLSSRATSYARRGFNPARRGWRI